MNTNNKSTVITVFSKLEDFKEAMEDLSLVVKEITSKVKLKEGLKILISADINKYNHSYFHIYVNEHVDIDIQKIWKHGHSDISQNEMSDQSKIIKYVCS